ncbi:Glycosyl transferase family 2 [Novipirellula aureliae]|uniref:Glycosyl transferase family 2 n=1 Tax=Novipirellula aureliae TaxID=2527966 RepID=A0A5C6E681_9BACT|nr:glycosyltransferase [Novipirellula aureliae]TWU44338.1 Glycosyl transferase family 2 [Novipirellula aureliae]
MAILWTIVLPTYRRPETLRLALEHIAESIDDPTSYEVLIYDNGIPESSQFVAAAFDESLPFRYTINRSGHGLGYSLCRGASEARGVWVLEVNDDALVPPNIFVRLESILTSDARIGVVGLRAVEDDYVDDEREIGVISKDGTVHGNFIRDTDGPIDVEHVYGFCYAYRRELLERGGGHDAILLAQDYSSGNRIETDHCLTAKKLGYRVVYDGSIAVKHLAKPRGDMNERSLKWKLNHTRNTLYLFLKHFGWFGRDGIAFRFCFLKDLGLRSALLHPSRDNWAYFLTGMRARGSAVFHWLRYLLFGPRLHPLSSHDTKTKE